MENSEKLGLFVIVNAKAEKANNKDYVKMNKDSIAEWSK